ncbi:MAG: S-layer homology domain-containing protein [Candidatus Aminicenantales bacterium]
MKKAFGPILLALLLMTGCVTYQPPPPNFYLDSLPQSIVAELSLDERILVEEAWKSLEQGKGIKARRALAKLGEESPFYYVGLGYAYFLMYDFNLAEDFFKAAARFSPDMALTHVGLAQVYLKTGQEDPAFAELREVLKRDPEHPWAKAQFAELKARKTQEALQAGRSHLAAGDTGSAREAFLKALYYTPDSSEAHLELADLFLEENKLENALVHLEAASAKAPESRSLLEKYANTLFLLNKNRKALEVYEKLAALDPANQEFQQRIEILKNRLGIFELPSQYHAIIASEAVSNEEMAALIAVKFQDYLKQPEKKPPIIIDIATSWASDFILKMTSIGLLDIYPNHTFRPKKIITRAEMAEILVRLLDYLEAKGYRFIQQIPPGKIEISDVSLDNYYYQPILQIISYDIMSLSADKTFNPDLPVSGQEAIKLLDIILGLIQ